MKSIIKKIQNKGLFKSIIYIIVAPFYEITKFICNRIFSKLRVRKNYVFFTSFPDFSDNAKVLYEYMIENKLDYKYIWAIKDDDCIKKLKSDKNTKFIKYTSSIYRGISIKAMYYMSISKNIFWTHYYLSAYKKGYKKKKEQIIFNLWHGCGYKSCEKNNWIEKHYFDYVLVPGNIFIKTKSKFFGCEKNKILPIGYPRYDLFLKEDLNAKNYLEQLKENCDKFIIWMPTFRKTKNGNYPEEKIDSKFDLPILNSIDEMKKLNEVCKDENVKLCIKRHPHQLRYKCEDIKLSNIIFISNDNFENKNIDLYAFLKYTDALISDYSSVSIDYILLDKPEAFCLDDFETYNKTRGFVFENPKEYMPGNHIYNFNDMKNFIHDVANNDDKYKFARDKIVDLLHNKTNNYCTRILDKLNEIEKM